MIVALYIIPDKYVQRASAWHSILGMCQRVFWYSNHSVNNEDVCFYGISTKRYALYTYENETITLVDHKLHGLSHLTNPYLNKDDDWQKEIWKDILKLHY